MEALQNKVTRRDLLKYGTVAAVALKVGWNVGLRNANAEQKIKYEDIFDSLEANPDIKKQKLLKKIQQNMDDLTRIRAQHEMQPVTFSRELSRPMVDHLRYIDANVHLSLILQHHVDPREELEGKPNSSKAGAIAGANSHIMYGRRSMAAINDPAIGIAKAATEIYAREVIFRGRKIGEKNLEQEVGFGIMDSSDCWYAGLNGQALNSTAKERKLEAILSPQGVGVGRKYHDQEVRTPIKTLRQYGNPLTAIYYQLPEFTKITHAEFELYQSKKFRGKKLEVISSHNPEYVATFKEDTYDSNIVFGLPAKKLKRNTWHSYKVHVKLQLLKDSELETLKKGGELEEERMDQLKLYLNDEQMKTVKQTGELKITYQAKFKTGKKDF